MHILGAVVLAAITFPAAVLSAPNASDDDGGLLRQMALQRGKLTRVTKRPYQVHQPGAQLCAQPNAALSSPHGDHWIHVFVSRDGRKALMSGKETYPVGTLILKQKFVDALGKRTDFYTGMRKREVGYSPQLGDWEFFTLDSTAKKVTSQGKIAACMNCHRQYAQSDFVSREYLVAPAPRVSSE